MLTSIRVNLRAGLRGSLRGRCLGRHVCVHGWGIEVVCAIVAALHGAISPSPGSGGTDGLTEQNPAQILSETEGVEQGRAG